MKTKHPDPRRQSHAGYLIIGFYPISWIYKKKPILLVGHAGSSVIHRAPLMSQGKAHTAGNGRPFPRGATQHWLISGAPSGPAHKPR
jgi:hypothetical protein